MAYEKGTREKNGGGRNEDVAMDVWSDKAIDRIKNDYIRGTVKVAEVTKKMQERRLQWYGHVMSREEESV